MGLSEWLNIFLGVGFLGSLLGLLKLFLIERPKNKAETKKTLTESKQNEVALEEAQLEQAARKTKIVTELLQDAEANAELVRNSKLRESQLLSDAQDLRIQIEGQQLVIDDHRKDRKDWMEMLKTTLEANAQREREFEALLKDVEELKKEKHNCHENVASLEGRMNIMVGILHNNNLEVPEGFIWTNSESHQVYPNGDNTKKE